ncbi:MAG: sodium:calcium antiporter [Acidobacteriota bacterium]|nr:MAG: sodium:calcium antiporter [Acidobacteriota bacterium]
MKNIVWLVVAIILPLPWMALELSGRGHHLVVTNPIPVAIIAGIAIVGAAFVLSWGAELSERDIPRSLALIVLALISVLPEYAVDLHFAWVAGKDPAYKAYAVANMTGANRVLIGIGWSLVAIVYYFKHRRKYIPLDQSQGLELSLLLLATIYSLVIPLKGTLSLIDTVVLFVLFLYYAGRAAKGHKHDEALEGIAGFLDHRLGNSARRLSILLMFAFAGYAIWLSAEPFAESLVTTGRTYGVDEFLLVQWLAPLASESPEAIVALLFAFKGKGSTGIGALISSKVNQWTLLVGAIPLVYAISAGILGPMDLDHRQKEELLLTSAQSLFAAVVISDFRFSLKEAIMLIVLFITQLFFTQEWIRYLFSGLYLVAAIILLASSKVRRQMLWSALLLKKPS